MIRHGTIHLQIAALLRSAIPLATDATKALRNAVDRRRWRQVPPKRHIQTRVSARSGRMITPLSPTAPASFKP